jgi:hypothetical protein
LRRGVAAASGCEHAEFVPVPELVVLRASSRSPRSACAPTNPGAPAAEGAQIQRLGRLLRVVVGLAAARGGAGPALAECSKALQQPHDRQENADLKKHRLAALALSALWLATPAAASLPAIEEKTAAMEKRDGFVPLYWSASEGRLYLEVSRLEQPFIYQVALAAGVGSNDIGLDRNQLGATRLVQFERVGPKLLLVEQNTRFRAGSDNAAEQRAVADAFARSVLWGFDVVAETGDRVLVDATGFALHDAHGVVQSLKGGGQGGYSLDAGRSALHLPGTRAFPRNSEIEVVLTFAGDEPGEWVRSVAPDPSAITVRERHSLVALPPPGYQPRESDPRAGFIPVVYQDYAAPLGEPLTHRLITRHRLQKKDPGAAISEAVEPIVYYLDPGTPEPIRSALLDGARWWARAFEAAGYRDAFRVEMLPEDADPLDVRYNVINWVHRSTRGWSYGSSVVDPRTGEILKGHVLLGSLRVRQDYLIAEGLLSPYETGDEAPPEPAAMALARLRQLSAHEVGHTIGLMHNYIASTQGRASVMDYPHPLARLAADGSIDLADAYAVGVGAWDEVAVTWGYQDFPDGADEAAALAKLLSDARARGLTFLTDKDARPPGSAHPLTHLWDNGSSAAEELERMMGVRRAALARLGDRTLPNGAPLATLEEALVPLYLHHRYQLEAAAKVVAGVSYEYALRGDGLEPLRPVPAPEQQQALEALLATLRPSELALPRPLLQRLPPRPHSYPDHRELFPRRTGLVFDAVSPASVAADLTLSMLLHPERAARLVQQHALDASLPSLAAVLQRLVAATFEAEAADGYEAEVARAVEDAVVDHLIALAARAGLPQARAVTLAALADLRDRLTGLAAGAEAAEAAHAAMLERHIGSFLEQPLPPGEPPPRLQAPPGSPIGSPAMEWLRGAACSHGELH